MPPRPNIDSKHAALAAVVLVCLLSVAGQSRPDGQRTALAADAGITRYAAVTTWHSQPRILWEPLWWPAGHRPGGLAWDAKRALLYVVDRDGATLRVYDATGDFLGELGTAPDGAALMLAPRAVAVMPDGRLVVSDPGRDELLVWNTTGALLSSWPVHDPRGVAATARGEIAVIAGDPSRLQLFNDAGRALRDESLDGLRSPEGLHYRGDLAGSSPPVALLDVVDPVGGRMRLVRLGATRHATVLDGLRGLRMALSWQEEASTYWLAAMAERGLLLASKEGRELDLLPFDDAIDVAIAPDGGTWATVMPQGVVRLADMRLLLDRGTDTFGRLLEPRRIAVGDSAIVADGAPRVQSWSREGVPLADLRFAGHAVNVPDEDISAPVDVAADGRHGYVLWRSGRIRRLADNGAGFDAMWQPAAPVGHWPVAIDARDGQVAIFDLVAQEVRLFDAGLADRGAWSVEYAAGRFMAADDIALADDAVFLIDPRRWTLEVFDQEGAHVATSAIDGRPMRVAAAPNGGALVLSEVGWVHAFDRDGEPRGAFPVGVHGDRPTDLAVDHAGRLYVTDGGGVIRVYEADPGAPTGLPLPAAPGGCSAVAYKSAQPPVIELGETVEVELVVDGTCPSDADAADIVITIDRSGSMLGRKEWAAKEAAIGFALQIDAPRSRLGLVSFATDSTLDLPLTEERGAVVRAIGALRSGGSTNLVEALDSARLAHVHAPIRLGSKRVIVFLSDGRHQVPTVDISKIQTVIDAVRARGITVFTIGLGADADANTLRRMATDPTHYYFSPTESELAAIYDQIAGRLRGTPLFEDVTITDVVPANMEYIHGSGTPLEPEWQQETRSLVWRLGRVEEPGFRLAYRLRPLDGGVWATNESASTDHVDGRRRHGRLVFPVPYVRVRGPLPTATDPPPTPTPSPTVTVTPSSTPTLTPTPSPTATPTATATSTPSPTATAVPPPRPIYLPLVRGGDCQRPRDGLDLVLVLDSSSSMLLATHVGGPPKVDAAVEAARNFIDLVANPDDRLGLVQFNLHAARLSPLTRDLATLRAAFEYVEVAMGTRIDAGLDMAGSLFAAVPYEPERRPVVVLLTDGRPTASSASHVYMAAERLKDAGVTIFTIGLGPDADPNLLRILATSPGYFFFAPGTDELDLVYRRVAAKIPPPCE